MSLRDFARLLDLSYTFVREMELGNRFPSDDLVLSISEKLELDPGTALLEVYHDRSPALGKILAEEGLV